MSDRICSFPECGKSAYSKDLCMAHYQQQRRGRELRPLRRVRQPWATPAEAFFSVVEQAGDCWEWQGPRSPEGYGRFSTSGTIVLAHRWAYEHLRSEIPEALVIDHLCRNRACVNPWHMEPVTNLVNVARGMAYSARNARKTHCIHGHPFSGENLIIRKSGHRACRACRQNDRAKRAALLARLRQEAN